MDFVRRIAPEHLILSDQSFGTFGEKCFVAELDPRAIAKARGAAQFQRLGKPAEQPREDPDQVPQ
jgi:hypothetical protein